MSDKKKVTFDFPIKSSPGILFQFLTTTEGLTQWFADHVDSLENDFSFFWDGYEEKARMILSEEDQMVRYRMEDSEENEFLEFKIEKSEISNSTILFVTEFVEDDEVADQALFWDTQINRLRSSLGGGN